MTCMSVLVRILLPYLSAYSAPVTACIFLYLSVLVRILLPYPSAYSAPVTACIFLYLSVLVRIPLPYLSAYSAPVTACIFLYLSVLVRILLPYLSAYSAPVTACIFLYLSVLVSIPLPSLSAYSAPGTVPVYFYICLYWSVFLLPPCPPTLPPGTTGPSLQQRKADKDQSKAAISGRLAHFPSNDINLSPAYPAKGSPKGRPVVVLWVGARNNNLPPISAPGIE